MAEDAEGTAGNVIGAVGPVLNAVPYVGPLLSAAASIGSGALKADAAKKQMARAQALRDQQVQKAGIDPNYLRKLRMDEMSALSGTPGYEQAKNALDQSTAETQRAIREASPSGNATLTAMNAAIAAKNNSLNTLAAQDAAAKTAARGVVSGDLSTLGDQGQARTNDQRSDRKDLNAAATNLENAGTANKVGATDQILSSIGALGSPKAGIFTGGGNQNYLNQLKALGFILDKNGKLIKIQNAQNVPYSANQTAPDVEGGNTINTTPSASNYDWSSAAAQSQFSAPTQ